MPRATTLLKVLLMLQTQLIELSKERNTVINNTTNNTNQQFNLQVFLNTDCKDAINLSDFIKTLKITLQDLEFTKTNGIVEGVSSIFVNNLKGMDVHKRPIHCTDLKRETMYVKNNEWVKDAKNQDLLKRFLRASKRGWQYTADNRAEAAKIFIKYAPAFTEEIAKLEIDGTMTILQSPRTKGKALGFSDEADWKDSQDLLVKFAEMKDPKPDVKVFFDNSFLSEAPYLPKK